MDAYYIEWIKWTKITMATFTFSPFYMSSFSTLPFSSAFSFLDTFAYTIKILQWELHFNLISCFAFHRRYFLFANLHVLTEIPFACFGELIATAPDDRVLRAFVSRCCWFPDRKWHPRVKLYQSRGKSTFYQSNTVSLTCPDWRSAHVEWNFTCKCCFTFVQTGNIYFLWLIFLALRLLTTTTWRFLVLDPKVIYLPTP